MGHRRPSSLACQHVSTRSSTARGSLPSGWKMGTRGTPPRTQILLALKSFLPGDPGITDNGVDRGFSPGMIHAGVHYSTSGYISPHRRTDFSPGPRLRHCLCAISSGCFLASTSLLSLCSRMAPYPSRLQCFVGSPAMENAHYSHCSC